MRKPLSQLPDWELVDGDHDLRGRALLGPEGKPLGTISEMIVDTETQRLAAIVMDGGLEFPASAFRVRNGQPVLTSATTPLHAGHSSDSDAVTGPRTDLTVTVAEEEVHPHKQVVQTGEVEVTQHVVEETQTVSVPVRRAELHVTRRDVDPSAPPGERVVAEDTIRIPIAEERIVVEKQPRVVGEVDVVKDVVQDEEVVSTTVRREEVEVKKSDAA